jgi:tetratricopeptide (TPR) repeat protein
VLAITVGVLDAAPARAQAPATGALDSASLLAVAAIRARETATRIEGRGTAAARAAARGTAATQYAAGLALLARGQFDSATAPLRAAATASPETARYRGDLAFALAAKGHWSDAEEEYRAAVRAQQANPWYFVLLGATQVAQEHWTQAAASFTLAVAADSAVIIRQLVGPASDAYEQSNMGQALDDWTRMAVVRFPEEPTPWLRIARADYLRRDTAAGLPAIRRYRAMKPDDRVGAVLYSEYLLTAGQNDSAVAMALEAAHDSSLKMFASRVIYNAGGHFLNASQFDRAAQVLQQGRDIAPAQDQPQFDLFIGIAKLKLLQAFYNDVVQHPDCRKSHPADSMMTDVTRLLTSGVAADSTLGQQVLTASQQYRTAIDAFVRQCRR